jgi:hypothetical protein
MVLSFAVKRFGSIPAALRRVAHSSEEPVRQLRITQGGSHPPSRICFRQRQSILVAPITKPIHPYWMGLVVEAREIASRCCRQRRKPYYDDSAIYNTRKILCQGFLRRSML